MNLDAKVLTVNGIDYIPKSEVSEKAPSIDGLPCVIVRTYSAGVFMGYLENHEGKEVRLRNARRLWVWYGAASLSQLAVDGTSRPSDCKFPVAVPSVILTEAIEILEVSSKAKKSIDGVSIWQA